MSRKTLFLDHFFVVLLHKLTYGNERHNFNGVHRNQLEKSFLLSTITCLGNPRNLFKWFDEQYKVAQVLLNKSDRSGYIGQDGKLLKTKVLVLSKSG